MPVFANVRTFPSEECCHLLGVRVLKSLPPPPPLPNPNAPLNKEVCRDDPPPPCKLSDICLRYPESPATQRGEGKPRALNRGFYHAEDQQDFLLLLELSFGCRLLRGHIAEHDLDGLPLHCVHGGIPEFLRWSSGPRRSLPGSRASMQVRLPQIGALLKLTGAVVFLTKASLGCLWLDMCVGSGLRVSGCFLILYVCFGVAGNGAYVILWHASLPEISSSLCSNSSTT